MSQNTEDHSDSVSDNDDATSAVDGKPVTSDDLERMMSVFSEMLNNVEQNIQKMQQEMSGIKIVARKIDNMEESIKKIEREQKATQRRLRDLDDAIPAPFTARENIQNLGYERNQYNRGTGVDGFQTGSRSKLTVLSDLNIG